MQISLKFSGFLFGWFLIKKSTLEFGISYLKRLYFYYYYYYYSCYYYYRNSRASKQKSVLRQTLDDINYKTSSSYHSHNLSKIIRCPQYFHCCDENYCQNFRNPLGIKIPSQLPFILTLFSSQSSQPCPASERFAGAVLYWLGWEAGGVLSSQAFAKIC